MTNWKRTLLASASGVVLAGSAQAADLPLKAGPAAIIPIANWTGPYIGVHLGVGGMSTSCGVGASTGTNGDCTGGYSGGNILVRDISVVGGIQAGYDWQDRYFVYGVAADWTWTNLKGTGFTSSGSISWQTKVNWLASFRGRAGLALDNTLVYVTGGVALGEFEDITNQGRDAQVTFTKTLVGWVAGAGVEHKWTRNWSMKFEYLHYDFGENTERYASPTGSNYTHRFSHVVDVARVGVNYRW